MPRQLYRYGTQDCRNLAGRAYADTSYHVDTIEGLRFLAKMIRRLRGSGCRPVT